MEMGSSIYGYFNLFIYFLFMDILFYEFFNLKDSNNNK